MIVDLTTYVLSKVKTQKREEEKKKKDSAAPPFNILTRLSNAFKCLSNVNGLLTKKMYGEKR